MNSINLFTKNFSLFFWGQTTSAIGDSFQQIALIFLVVEMKGSGTELALSQACLIIPRILLLLWGGVLTDRFNSKVILWSMDLVRMFTTSAVVILLLTNTLTFNYLYTLLLFSGLASGIYYPAFNAIVPSIVEIKDLDSANGWVQSITQLATIIGPPLAGLLISTLGVTFGFIVNSISFFFAGTTGMMIKTKKNITQKTNTNTTIFRDLLNGFRYIWSVKWLLGLLIADLFASLSIVGPLTITLPLYSEQSLQLGANLLGVVVAAFGAGSVVGMIIAPRIKHIFRSVIAFYVYELLQGLLLIFIGIPKIVVVISTLLFIGLFNGLSNVIMLSTIQQKTSSNMLGRTLSFVSLASFGAVPLSQLLSGWLMNFLSYAHIFVSASLLTLVTSGLGLLIVWHQKDSILYTNDQEHKGNHLT